MVVEEADMVVVAEVEDMEDVVVEEVLGQVEMLEQEVVEVDMAVMEEMDLE